MSKFDYAIFGSNIVSALIAGILAREHKKKVCLLADSSIPHRLTRELPLSFNCMTRPQSWDLLNSSVADASRLLTKIGGGKVLENVNPLLVCQSTRSVYAMKHMAQIVNASGGEMEAVILRDLEGARASYRVRGVKLVNLTLLWPDIIRWLNVNNVVMYNDRDARIKHFRDGAAQIYIEDVTHDAANLVLADDRAITKFVSKRELERDFHLDSATTLLTEPAKNRETVVISPDNGFCARHSGNSGSAGVWEMMAHADAASIGQNAYNNIPGNDLLRQAGQASFSCLRSRDGAPVVGAFSRSRFHLIGGFGQLGVFLAPALARSIIGQPRSTEADYFEQHRPGAQRAKRGIADIGPIVMDRVAA